jgi:histidinol phosphatase-like PHP family hydrolase
MDTRNGPQSKVSKTMPFYEQDLQLQTTYSDGRSSIEEIVLGSIINGRKIVGITDHAIGWSEGTDDFDLFATGKEFENYLHDIETAKNKYREQGITVLAGLEVEIGLEGQMALAKGILEVVGSEANLSQCIDYAIGVIHSESFTVSLKEVGEKLSEQKTLDLLMKNIAGLISNPHILIWGHPFQVVHGHFRRDYTATERQAILSCLEHRHEPLHVEYNLNPYPRYEEWKGITNLYATGELVPNDLAFFEACVQLGSTFVVSTDAHDIEQTGRLNPATIVPESIKDRVILIV